METETEPHPSEEMPEEVPSLPPDGSEGTERFPGESAERVGKSLVRDGSPRRGQRQRLP
jgi:hypothetical protein